MDDQLNSKTPYAEGSQRLLEEVLASSDPAAMFAFGSSLGVHAYAMKGEPGETLVNGDQAGAAWRVAACRMGYDCAPGGVLMENVCLNLYGCAGDDYEAYVRKGLGSEAERRELERRVAEILRLVEGL